jgi:hypothetical protein
MIQFLFLIIFWISSYGATIAIIDTGFDIDHEFLQPKIYKSETDEEIFSIGQQSKLHGWNFHDNSHLKESVFDNPTDLEEVLQFRALRAKGHKQGLSPEEFDWFAKKNADKTFMEKVKKFKKQSHGTFVAGIALREGDNIDIFPIRGLNIPIPVVAINDPTTPQLSVNKNLSGEEKFKAEIEDSLLRITKKFAKICYYISIKKIPIANASYGITYKNIISKFRENYLEITGQEINEQKLQEYVNFYFDTLYKKSTQTLKKYPHILFIFSAGNSGLNNDDYHHYPSRIQLPNTITVAAMNGDFLATFSNFGKGHVHIGAPGVGIPSLVPSVYTSEKKQVYSPSSGTSMAAPYISNLAAQILNTNTKLKAHEIKKIILETGEIKFHLQEKLISSAIVDNQKALKAAKLSLEMPLNEAINLSKIELVPAEDQISLIIPQAKSAEDYIEEIKETLPQVITPQEVEEEPSIETLSPTKPSSSLPKDPETKLPDSSAPQVSTPPDSPEKSSDQAPSNQIEEPPQKPSEDLPASSSESEQRLPSSLSPESSPSLPQ